MEPDIGQIILNIIVLIVLVLINAFFAMSEIAILQSNQNRTKKLADEGNKKAQRLLKITANPSDFLATIQVGVTLSGFLASAVAADKFSGMLADALSFLPISQSLIESVSLVVITFILSYFTLVFGELVPKRLAMKYADKLAFAVSGILNGLYRILKPIIHLLSASTNGVSQLLGVSPEDEESVTEEDILLMVEEGEEAGVIHEMEMKMIQNILDLDDKPVSDVMTHRGDMTMISGDSPVSELTSLSKAKGYSRIPVFENDFDNIVGIAYIKDLIGLPEKDSARLVREFIHKPLYIPEGKRCSKLIHEFQEKKIHMAIVIDEYGGTAGLVTLEDLLEVIVGSIQDETDNEVPEINQIGEDYLFDGDLLLEEVEEALHIKLPETYGCDTIGGYIMVCLDKIPEEPETEPVPLTDGFFAVAHTVEDRRIGLVRVYREEQTEKGRQE